MAFALVISYVASGAWLWVATRMSPRAFAGRVGMLTLALVIPLIVLEVPAAFGWIDYRVVLRTPSRHPLQNPHFIDDDELLFRNPPGAHRVGVSSQTSITRDFVVPDPVARPFDLQFDHRGFRNPPGVERADLAFVGDSFTEGIWVTHEQLWTTRVGTSTGRTVANFGTIAWGPQQELVALRRYALPVRPQVVVWQFFEGNDLGDIGRYDLMLPHLASSRSERHGASKRSLTRNLIAKILFAASDRPSAIPYSGLLTLSDESRQRTYFQVPGRPLDANDEQALRDFSEILGDAARSVDAAGARLLVLFVPEKFRIYRELVEFDPEAVPRAWSLNDLPQRVERLVADLRPAVDFLDLTSQLRESAKVGRPPYFTDDNHWSPVGHEVAAEAVAEFITKRMAQR